MDGKLKLVKKPIGILSKFAVVQAVSFRCSQITNLVFLKVMLKDRKKKEFFLENYQPTRAAAVAKTIGIQKFREAQTIDWR